MSWLTGSLPSNALPAASAIAAAVIVVFLGSFAAFRFLDEDEPTTIPASTQSVTDLAQSVAETAGATETVTDDPAETAPAPTDDVAGEAFATEEPTTSTEAADSGPATEPLDNLTLDATEAPVDEATQPPPPTEPPAPPPTDAPVPTEAPTETVSPTPVPSLQRLLGRETREPIDDGPEPTTVPTDVPTAPPPTDEPTAIPTDVPTAIPTEEPTATFAPEPTDEPEATESASDLRILGPPGDAVIEATSEPPTATTVPPTATLVPEPTDEPTPTPVPTEEPEPTIVPTPTVVPIIQIEQIPAENGEEADDAGSNPESSGEDTPEPGPDGREDDDDGDDFSGDDRDDGVGSSGDQGDDNGNQEIQPDDDGEDSSIVDDDEGEQTILPTGGLEDAVATPQDAIAAPAESDDDDDSSSSQITSESTTDGESPSLGEADIAQPVEDIPGDQSTRLGLGADDDLIFSVNPGRVSLSENGITLETGEGPTDQVVVACDGNDSCVDISSASSDGGTTDSPIGWLDGDVIYERVRGDDFAVAFHAVAIDTGSQQPGEDRLIGGGNSGYEVYVRPYPVDGGLLIPVSAGWLLVSSSSVDIIDDYAFGQDVSLIRLDQSSGLISYVSGGNLILAATSSPGSPMVQLPFSGSDYDFSPDGSRVAVVTGDGIEIWDTAGIVLATYPNDDGITLGSLTWLNQGLVFVDLTNGVLRIIQP